MKIKILLFVVIMLTAADWPTTSLYSIERQWISDNEAAVPLDVMSGRHTLLTMIYTHCPSACPITVRRLKEVKDLADQKNLQLNIGLVSMDSSRDVPARLSAFRKEQQLTDEWKIFTGTSDQVRELAVLLGFNYQKDEKTGEFQHSNKIVLLNAKGTIQHSFDGMSATAEEFLEVIGQVRN